MTSVRNFRLSESQRKALNLLLDKYEGSKTYKGTNQVSQSFRILPTDVWREYNSDFARVDTVRDFESEMGELEECGLVRLKRNRRKGCAGKEPISKIEAVVEMVGQYYKLLDRAERSEMERSQLAFYCKMSGSGAPWTRRFCDEQAERISAGKKATYDLETAKALVGLLERIAANDGELLERELSVLVLGDSKAFERSYRSRVCKLIDKYEDFSAILEGVDEQRERERMILEEYGVYANPSYVYMKGAAHLTFGDGSAVELGRAPIAFSAEHLKTLVGFELNCETVMTVENFASFHRMKGEDCFYIFLAGYHNSAKQRLLHKIAEKSGCKRWLHFGDIDPDGFYILEHLKRRTGIDFIPHRMGVSELEAFREHGKKLERNDVVKAENLLRAGLFCDVMRYMLENDCKLEQEVISFHERTVQGLQEKEGALHKTAQESKSDSDN